jgi:DNA-binding HxlR family transcriptional regulator
MAFLLESGFLQETNPRNYLLVLYLYPMAMQKKIKKEKPPQCSGVIIAIRDAMELLSGKWKIQIIGALMHTDKMRFMDLLRDVDGIGAKMLSKELQELEINELVKREVQNTKPITVEYEITSYGRTLNKVIGEIAHWGIAHRKRVFKKA